MKQYTLVTGACINTGVAIVEKFAAEGRSVIFTGRSPEKVATAQARYREKYPDVDILGYAIDSLLDERTVDEASVEKLFAWLDSQEIFEEIISLLHCYSMKLYSKRKEKKIKEVLEEDEGGNPDSDQS